VATDQADRFPTIQAARQHATLIAPAGGPARKHGGSARESEERLLAPRMAASEKADQVAPGPDRGMTPAAAHGRARATSKGEAHGDRPDPDRYLDLTRTSDPRADAGRHLEDLRGGLQPPGRPGGRRVLGAGRHPDRAHRELKRRTVRRREGVCVRRDELPARDEVDVRDPAGPDARSRSGLHGPTAQRRRRPDAGRKYRDDEAAPRRARPQVGRPMAMARRATLRVPARALLRVDALSRADPSALVARHAKRPSRVVHAFRNSGMRSKRREPNRPRRGVY
jgi:hypothetical protein